MRDGERELVRDDDTLLVVEIDWDVSLEGDHVAEGPYDSVALLFETESEVVKLMDRVDVTSRVVDGVYCNVAVGVNKKLSDSDGSSESDALGESVTEEERTCWLIDVVVV